MRLKFPLILLVVFFGLLSNCKDKLPTEEDPSSIILPDSNISYSRDVERVFSAWCLSCHSGSYEPNLLPPSYNNLRNFDGGKLVVAGDGQNSLLIQLLEGTLPPPMPPGSQKLTENQIQGIKKWIDEGAMNN